MGKASREKGRRGELEWKEKLQQLGFPLARRGAHGPDRVDVEHGIPGTHCEVKRTERLRLDDAMDQAEKACGDGRVPYVAHRRNRGHWMVTILADDLHDFARLVYHAGALSKEA